MTAKQYSTIHGTVDTQNGIDNPATMQYNCSKEVEPMKIQFEAGTSRHGDFAVNFLISEDRTLYAEIATPEDASDDYGYLTLKTEIQKQAAAAGIANLDFWYDGQEQYLAPDAAAQGEIRGW